MKRKLAYYSLGIALMFTVSYIVGYITTDSPVPSTERSASQWPTPTVTVYDNYFARGEYYFNQDADPAGPYDLERARHYYMLATKQQPVPEAAWYQLGQIAFISEDYDQAQEYFQKQLDMFGTRVPEVFYAAGLNYGYQALETKNEQHWNAAEEAFLTFIDIVPTSPWPRVDLAWVYFSQGEYEAMIPHLETALQYEADNPWVLNAYGLALMNLDRREEASLAFIQAQDAAATLTNADWGAVYSGNSPYAWDRSLEVFRQTIAKNLTRAKTP